MNKVMEIDFKLNILGYKRNVVVFGGFGLECSFINFNETILLTDFEDI